MNTRPNPYIGPRAFQAGEPFYGRESELDSLFALLVAERIVLLHSPSGSGKTSLIQAGLLPRLSAENFSVLPIIRVNLEPPQAVAATPGFNRYVLSTLLSLEENLPETQRLSLKDLAGLSLNEYLDKRPRVKNASISDVLIFDQFEEVLTMAPTDRENKQIFFEQLGRSLRNHDRWALVAIREDYLGALAPYVRPVPGRFSATLRLDLIGVDGALQAIQKPAQANKVDFGSSVAMKLVDDLRRVQVQLPDGSLEEQLGPYVEPVQLQVVSYRLWQGLTDTDMCIDEDDLAGVGDVNRSLAGFYANSIKNIAEKSGNSEREIREWFEHKLITPNGIRGQALMGAENSDGLPNTVVRLLEDAHLIRGEKRAGKTWYELSHDRMIKPVREDDATWFTANLSLFQQQAALWVQQGQPEGMLLRGSQLDQAESEAKTKHLNDDEQAFLEACRKLRRQENREKLRTRVIMGLAIGATLALIAAVIFGLRAASATHNAQLQAAAAQTSEARAVLNANAAATAEANAVLNANAAATAQANAEIQKQKADEQARLARTGELAMLASNLRTKDFQLSMLVSVEAFQSQDLTQSRGALLDSAQANPHLRKFLNGHTGPVNSVAFSPLDGGKTLASGGQDNTIILWDVATGKPIGQPLRGHTGPVNSIAFSPDGKILASGSADKSIILWDVATGRPIGQPLAKHEGPVNSVAFSPDGKTLASGSEDTTIILWDVATRQPIDEPLEEHEEPVYDVTFSPDGKKLASGDAGGTILLWDVESGESIGEPLEEHESSVDDVDFSPDGKMLASGSDDRTIILWNVATGLPIGQPLIGHTDEVYSVDFSPDGKTLVSGSADDTVILWDLATGKPINQPFIGHKGQVQSVAFGPDGKTLASGSNDKTIILWNVDVSQPSTGHSETINSVAFSPDGKLLASGSDDNTIIVWDAITLQPIGRPLTGHEDAVNAVAFSPLDGGKTLASGSNDETIILWDAATGKPIGQPLRGHTGSVQSVAFSPDGKLLASGSDDDTVILWDLTTGKPIGQPLAAHKSGVTDVAFSPDGKVLASSSEDSTIILWDVATGKPLGQPLKGHTASVFSIAFSPLDNGKILASGSSDNTIILWDVATHQIISQLTGHTGQVFTLAFSPDGKLLASGSDDGTIILWNLASGEPLGQPLNENADMITNVAFSPDGKTLASESSKNTILLWDLVPQSWVEKTCQRAGRNITRIEWKKYFPNEEYRSTCPQWPPAAESAAEP